MRHVWAAVLMAIGGLVFHMFELNGAWGVLTMYGAISALELALELAEV